MIALKYVRLYTCRNAEGFFATPQFVFTGCTLLMKHPSINITNVRELWVGCLEILLYSWYCINIINFIF